MLAGPTRGVSSAVVAELDYAYLAEYAQITDGKLKVTEAEVEAVLRNPHHTVEPRRDGSIRYTCKVAGRRISVAASMPGIAADLVEVRTVITYD
jgi:hypothetical protein